MNSIPHAAESSSVPPKPGMAQKWLVAILVLTFAFVLMPFLLWYMTTFTRPLNDADLAAYFSEQGSDELRVTSAWVMGQDNQAPEFRAALVKQLADANPMVQRNAALSL